MPQFTRHPVFKDEMFEILEVTEGPGKKTLRLRPLFGGEIEPRIDLKMSW